jgi:hypothetical protein
MSFSDIVRASASGGIGMRKGSFVALIAALAGTGCGASPQNDGITVSPSSARVLTCGSQVFTATLIDQTDKSVAWSVAPAGAGTIDATGTYAAPLATPASPQVTVTATSHADPTLSVSATATVATAFPSGPTTIPGSTNGTSGVFPHSIAAKGGRMYSVWGTPDSGTPKLMVSRSDDGGTTWRAGVAAVSLTLASGLPNHFGAPGTCAAVAIDAGSPDVVYVYARIGDPNDVGEAVYATGDTSFLSVSTDGGATFTTTVMEGGGTAGGPHGGWDSAGICGDVVSPAANTVVVESPGNYLGDGNPDIAIWADTARGAGFAIGTAVDGDYLADGYTDALDNLLGDHAISVQQAGSTDDSGGAPESPRLFTDGAGRVCVTYYGVTHPVAGHDQSHVYVQCSNDTARTFSAPLVVDPAQPLDAAISSPVGAFGPGGAAAILWTNGITVGQLLIATSHDGAASFGTPVVIPTYQLPGGAGAAPPQNPSVMYDADGVLWVSYVAYDGGTHTRVIVDKSCDGGRTWSGAVLVNGPEGAIADMRLPALAVTWSAAPTLVATAASHLAYFTLAP